MYFTDRGNGHRSGFGRAGEANFVLPTSRDGRGGAGCTGEEEISYTGNQTQGYPGFWQASPHLFGLQKATFNQLSHVSLFFARQRPDVSKPA